MSFISSFIVFLGSLQASNGTWWEKEKGTWQTAWVSFRANWEVVSFYFCWYSFAITSSLLGSDIFLFQISFVFRYSTMLAENLVDANAPAEKNSAEHQMSFQCKDIGGDIINEPKEANVGG